MIPNMPYSTGAERDAAFKVVYANDISSAAKRLAQVNDIAAMKFANAVDSTEPDVLRRVAKDAVVMVDWKCTHKSPPYLRDYGMRNGA